MTRDGALHYLPVDPETVVRSFQHLTANVPLRSIQNEAIPTAKLSYNCLPHSVELIQMRNSQ
jgi:hypothetical protein